ncbi:MAG: cytochrome C oxidase subunit IV family protein [Burkholderiaceae bacterium]|nr:cytochrome C oxidase subunit IV family protein [Burkholderiaceae bacterium]
MLSTRAATVNWLALLGLTAVTFALAENDLGGRSLIWPVLAIIFLKGRIVVDRFMGLQGVRGPWRALALGWLALVVGIIGYSFTLSYPAN